MKIVKIIGIVLLLLIIAIGIFIATFQPPEYSDFGVYTNLRNYTTDLLKKYGANERPITQEFSELTLQLSFPFNKLFGSDVIAVPIKSFQNEKMGVATISQFQVPPGSDYYRDFTLHIRPEYGLKAPIFHIDFMKPSPGTPGLCSMDFFNPDTENISVDEFFGTEIESVKEALSLIERYQRSVEEGRGKITAYLDPYKSEYRFELMEPPTDSEKIREEYYTTVEKAVKLVLAAYLKSLHRAAMDPGYAQAHEDKTKDLVILFYKNDFAIALGKRVFQEHFEKYWLDGFWNVQVELED